MDRVVLILVGLAAISCGGADSAPAAESRDAPVYVDAPAPPAARTAPRVVVLGDSLTAGLGLSQDDAYPSQLQRRLKETKPGLEVVNAGVSGDTSSDGLARTNWALDGDVRLLVLALGANDGLRGLPVPQMRENLQAIITRARQRGIPVLLVGMEAPPNFGEEYANAFRQMFRDLARENKIELVPFLLDGVAGVSSMNQSDGIHPNRAGAARIAEHLWPVVEKMLGNDAAR